jgi:hypothetical protein
MIDYDALHKEGILSDESFQKIKTADNDKLFSLFWELKTLLYLGVLLLTTGLGILIYKNIDTIGHQAIVLFIAAVSASCFVYCFKKKLAFSKNQVSSPNVFFDYVLLLGCLTFVMFIAYIQFQFGIFGNKYGLATFIPMIILFFVAYFFDHLGVLSMAITSLAAWAGLAVTPATILKQNDFNSRDIIFTALLLGVVLIVIGYETCRQKLKSHFQFTYYNFGLHIFSIASIAAMVSFENIYFLLFVAFAAISCLFYTQAIRLRSFYFLLIIVLYAYVALSYTFLRFLFVTANTEIAGAYLAFFYFIASAIGIVLFLISMNKKLKQHDSL